MSPVETIEARVLIDVEPVTNVTIDEKQINLTIDFDKSMSVSINLLVDEYEIYVDLDNINRQ